MTQQKDAPMLTAIILTALILVGLGIAVGPGPDNELIAHRPYNNRYNDASGARDDHLG